MLMTCQNAAMRVYGAWIKIWNFLCSKTYSSLAMCYHSPLVRDKLLAAPASVKLIYWRSCPVFNTNGHLVDPGDQKLDWNSQIWPWARKNHNRFYKKGNFLNISRRLRKDFSFKRWSCPKVTRLGLCSSLAWRSLMRWVALSGLGWGIFTIQWGNWWGYFNNKDLVWLYDFFVWRWYSGKIFLFPMHVYWPHCHQGWF